MSQAAKHLYEFGPFRMDPSEGLLLRDGQPIPLAPLRPLRRCSFSSKAAVI